MKPFIQMCLAFLFVAAVSWTCPAQSKVILNYAGPSAGTRAVATAYAIGSPSSVAPDGAGGFYVASALQNSVFRVTADGRIHLAAGNGSQGFSGDGGPAIYAQLYEPSGIAVDAEGNLFIADAHNYRVRKITPDGVINTIAGNGTYGYSGDGGPATSAQFNYSIGGIAVDAQGNLFIADEDNQRIRKVSPDGVIGTVAGNGIRGFSGDGGPATSAQLAFPSDVKVDLSGNLYISDSRNYRIRKVSPDGTIRTVAGNGIQGNSGDGGLATEAQLYHADSIAVDASNNLFIADWGSYCVRKVTAGGIINTVAGNGTYGFSGDGGPATSAQLQYISSAAVDAADNLFIADGNRVRRVSPDGVIRTAAGNGTPSYSGDGGPATSAQLYAPKGIAMDAAGALFIADTYNYRIRKITPDGVIRTVAGNGTPGYSGDGGPATSARLDLPSGVAVDASGNLFIADSCNHGIRKVTPDGMIRTVMGSGVAGCSPGSGGVYEVYPCSVAVDGAGNLFIANHGDNSVQKITADGAIRYIATAGSYAGAGCRVGVTVDRTGNLFVTDSRSQRILKVEPDGTISTVAGGGDSGLGDGGPATEAQLNEPSGIALDSSGDLFIADKSNYRVRKVTPDGVIATVAGDGTQNCGGSGGPATSAQLYGPIGVAVDDSDKLYILDGCNHIRVVADAPVDSLDLALTAGGSAVHATPGLNGPARTGYATLAAKSGAVPYATAVYRFRKNGVAVSEAGVPASPPAAHARIFIDLRDGVRAIPGRGDAGVVNINTGIAIANTGSETAHVVYTLRNLNGDELAAGHGDIAAGNQFSCFVDQLKDVAAADFNLPGNFKSAIQFASLDISSSQPLSVLALRGTNNQRNDFLVTTTPAANFSKSSSSAAYFPHFADGGGYTTSLVLMNASNRTEKGTLKIMDDSGRPLQVTQAGGASDSSFSYSIPSGGAFHFQTDGSPQEVKTGWIRVVPELWHPMPAGSAVISYNPEDVLISESGIPFSSPTTHARIYVDLSNNHNTGLGLANVTNADAAITISAFETDGVTAAGIGRDPVQLSAYGHAAAFADQFVEGLPEGFAGVLDVRSETPFAALTLRSLLNERHDFLMTTFPVADVNQAPPAPVIFPQIADGGGYTTEFILLSPLAAADLTLSLFDPYGALFYSGE